MDCRVTDGQVEPLVCRIEYKRPAEWDTLERAEGQWPHDDAGRALAYTTAERDEITHALDAAKITYKVVAEDQPDAAHLAQLQGHISSRSEALAALEALGQGDTPDIPEFRLKAIEAAAADLDARLTTVEEKPAARETTL